MALRIMLVLCSNEFTVYSTNSNVPTMMLEDDKLEALQSEAEETIQEVEEIETETSETGDEPAEEASEEG